MRSPRISSLALTAVFVGMAIVPASSQPAANCNLSSYTALSTAAPGCIGAGSSCTISGNVYVDKSYTRAGNNPLGTITISGGALAFPDASVRVEAASITIGTPAVGGNQATSGTLQIGAAGCPIGTANPANLVEVDFYGTNPGTLTCANTGESNAPPFDKGICFNSGTLSILGAKGANTPLVPAGWTHLRCPAGPSATYGPNLGVAAPVQGAHENSCPGDSTTLLLHGAVNWQPNDWIVVGGTGYSDDQSEFVQIASIVSIPPLRVPPIIGRLLPDKQGYSYITLNASTPLLHYHFGGADPESATGHCIAGDGKTKEPASFCAGKELNYGVDERAEVGLISRNIRLSGRQAWWPGATYETGATIVAMASNGSITQAYLFQATTGGASGATPPTFPSATGSTVADGAVTWTNEGNSAPSGDLHWGGEIKLLEGAALSTSSVTIQGAELEEFGKDQLGSYPIHFHMLGALPSGVNPVVAYNSIHHSYDKCVTVHMTDGVAITGNVCARIVGHIFYLESGEETGNTFTSNLGLGAMNNMLSFQPSDAAAELNIFWDGDYLAANPARPLNYDEFNIPYTEDTTVPNSGPSSGFWISNANNNFIGNSIGGCQGSGQGFWYEASSDLLSEFQPFGTFKNNRAHGCEYGLTTADTDGTVIPGSTYGKQTPVPRVGGVITGQDLVADIDGITATRNRTEGVWVRAGWYHVKNARLAGNREGVSMVSGGGAEGIEPGLWGLTSDSVIVGISQNNPERFGPCFTGMVPGNQAGCIVEPYSSINKGYPAPSWNLEGVMFYDGPMRIANIRFVNFKKDPFRTSSAKFPQDPNSSLTYADQAAIQQYNSNSPNNYKGFAMYEGDAAIGWFQSNVNAYPPTQSSEGLSWDNVDLKHQVYSQQTDLGAFADGDKNTAILDRDGTLAGYGVIDAKGNSLAGKDRFPISLNNIPINSVTNQPQPPPSPPKPLLPGSSVDECHAEGLQDATIAGPGNTGENRPTALMSPGEYATLEITDLAGASNGGGFANSDLVTITKDQIDYSGVQILDTPSGGTPVPCAFGHGCVVLVGRNFQGVYEPKVENGLGYTLTSSLGFPGFTYGGATTPYLSLGFVDASFPKEATPPPFSVRVGICYSYKDQKGNLHQPANVSSFQVLQGRKSYGSPVGNQATLSPYYAGSPSNTPNTWNDLSYANSLNWASPLNPPASFCGQLDNTPVGLNGVTYPNTCGITVGGSVSGPACTYTGSNNQLVTVYGCPAPNPSGGQPGQGVVTPLTPVTVTTNLTAKPPTTTMPQTLAPGSYYYDSATGMLYLQMQQTELNEQGSSPLGSCPGGDSACTANQHFYPCPANGCVLYTIRVTDSSYAPTGTETSACSPYNAGGQSNYFPGVWDAYPTGMDSLAYISPDLHVNGHRADITPVSPNAVGSVNYPHNAHGGTGKLSCPETSPTP